MTNTQLREPGLVLNVFVEIAKYETGSTPFNILPTSLARYGDFLEFAAIIPSSPFDLSRGWTRTRHTMGMVPTVSFYSEKDIPNIIEQNEKIKTQCLIFFASNLFSVPLICELAKQVPTIVATNNTDLQNKLKSNENIRTVSYGSDTPRYSVFRECLSLIIRLFVEHNNKDFEGNPISKDFFDSYCIAKSFLSETNVSPALLCRANEIVLAQTRGKLPNELREPQHIESEDAYIANVDVMNEILAERLADILLGAVSGERVVNLKRASNKLMQTFKDSAAKLTKISAKDKAELYMDLKRAAFAENSVVFSGNGVFLLIPTVNLAVRDILETHLRQGIPSSDWGSIGRIVDRVLMGGRGIYFLEDELTKSTKSMAEELANTRLKENVFLTNLVGLMASRKLVPVLKTTTAPSVLFRDIASLRSQVGLGLLSQKNNPSWCMTTGERFLHLQNRLNQCVPRIYLNSIENANPSEVTIVSDLPFELAQLRSELSICQTFPTTRIPITPLGTIFSFCQRTARGSFVDATIGSIDDIMFINAIQKDDPVFSEFESFREISNDHGFGVKTQSISSKDEFISRINLEKPKVLIYFGHGSYNDKEDKGELVFKDDRLSLDSLNEIERIPPIVFLMGCETASCSAFFGGLPPHLLRGGASAILATIFPIPAEEANVFLGRTISLIYELINEGQTTGFSNVIFAARKMGWIRDNLDLLWRIGGVSLPEGALIFKETTEIADRLSRKRGCPLPITEAAEIFKSILNNHNCLEVWETHRRNVIPYSLFFTLIGDAHSVLIHPE